MTRPIYFCPQPKGANLCGQCCVAMVLGIPLDEATSLVGKRGLTHTRHLRAALETRGWTLGVRLDARRVVPELGNVYMARVYWEKPNNSTHWVLVNAHGIVVDPAAGFDPEWTREEGPYITSYYEVRGPTDRSPA